MRNRVAVLVVVVLAAFGVLAGTASASGGPGGSITCTHTISPGAGSFECTNAQGQKFSCSARWSFRPLSIVVECTTPEGTKSFRYP